MMHITGPAGSPRTLWLAIPLPWKRTSYDINQDAPVKGWARLMFGFRFWLG